MKWPDKLVAGVVALLAVIAVLQYRGIAQASRSERARLGSALQSSLTRFAQEFDGEISRAFIAANGAGPPDRQLDDPAPRIAGWMSASPYRNLVRAFYRYRQDNPQRFNPDTESFEPIIWPSTLSGVSRTLDAWVPGMGPPILVLSPNEGLVIAGRRITPREFSPAPVKEPAPSRTTTAPQSDPRPFSRSGERGSGRRRAGPPLFIASRGPEAHGIPWTVIELNLDYIQREMLPRLAAKHLPADFEWRVVERADRHHVLFSSSPPEFGTPDAAIPLLELRAEAIPGAAGRRGGGAGGRPGGGSFPRAGMPLGQNALWEIQARHIAGSLDAAASQSRNRDLAVSTIVLVLLLTTIAALVIVTRRAQRLADLQMEFVSGVSHELRTPLAVIGSAADNLADGVVATDAQVRRYGALIRGEGRRLTEMIEQVLSYSGLQSGRKPIERRPVDIAAVIDRAIAACAGQIEETACTVDTEIPGDLPCVAADEASLIHCIANLLANALKYGDPGHLVRIAAASRANTVEIRVSDTGFGIDPADLPHIFDAFYRGRTVAGGTIRGTGLGLNLVRRIAQAHDGAVSVESTLGAGSCFTLRLPAAPEVAA
ncbi:MAG: integral rane sensor signal transduction histidine kinase [Candidatus Solibacter sp.]|nr:integral rane sensor signal transduction histidine kinase [Candidatus Solibacter sp.]